MRCGFCRTLGPTTKRSIMPHPSPAEDMSFHPKFDRIRWVDAETGDARLAAWRAATLKR